MYSRLSQQRFSSTRATIIYDLILPLKDGGLLPLPFPRIQIVHLTIIKLFYRHPSRNTRAAEPAGPHRRHVCVWRQNFSVRARAGSLCLPTRCRLRESFRRPIFVICFPIMRLSVPVLRDAIGRKTTRRGFSRRGTEGRKGQEGRMRRLERKNGGWRKEGG